MLCCQHQRPSRSHAYGFLFVFHVCQEDTDLVGLPEAEEFETEQMAADDSDELAKSSFCWMSEDGVVVWS